MSGSGKRRTWIWVIVGILGCFILGMIAVAGAGVYFVAHHFAVERTTSSNALRTFDTTRATFATAKPLIEWDSMDRPREAERVTERPTSSSKPTNLYVLAWNPEDGRLARVTLPFWLLKLGRRKMNFLDNGDFDFERLEFDVPELERIGPALVLDYRSPAGERVLIWTQ